MPSQALLTKAPKFLTVFRKFAESDLSYLAKKMKETDRRRVAAMTNCFIVDLQLLL
jgi:hypothetical protein